MIDLSGVAELQQLIATLEGARLLFDNPTQAAGDPNAIGDLAQAHRHVATALRTMLDDLQTRTTAVLGEGRWEGPASIAYAHYWSGVHGQIGELASRHDRMAGSLDDIAARTALLNSETVARLGEAGQWLGSAGAAVLRLDLGGIMGLLGQGRTLVSDWERLIRDLEEHAAWTRDQLAADLGFSGPAAVGPVSPDGASHPPGGFLPFLSPPIIPPLFENEPLVNRLGLDGYQLIEDLGPVSSLKPEFRTPQQVMAYFEEHPQEIFPFGLRGAQRISRLERIDLATPTSLNDSPVVVTGMTATSFTFTSLRGHFDPPGSTIRFRVYESQGEMCLEQTGRWKFTSLAQRPVSYASIVGAYVTWGQMGNNLRQVVND
jgi:uncharacterized protein YukE